MQTLMPAVHDPQALTGPLETIDTPELKQELGRALSVTARHLTYLAGIWQELERRGEDLSDLRVGLAEYLPAIADGTLDPDAVVRFAGKRMLLKRLIGLPLEQQQRIALDEPIAVVSGTDDGIVEALVPPSSLSAGQIVQAFGAHGVRTAEQQRATRRSRQGKKKTRSAPSQATILFDRQTGALKIGRIFVRRGRERVSVEQITAALSAYHGLDLSTLIQEKKDHG